MYCMLVVERVLDIVFWGEVAGASHRKAFLHFFTHFFAIFDDFSKFHNMHATHRKILLKYEENPCFYLEYCRLTGTRVSSTTHLTASMYRSAKLLCNSEYT